MKTIKGPKTQPSNPTPSNKKFKFSERPIYVSVFQSPNTLHYTTKTQVENNWTP